MGVDDLGTTGTNDTPSASPAVEERQQAPPAGSVACETIGPREAEGGS